MVMVCPSCKGSLIFSVDEIFCQNCNTQYRQIDSIPCFINPDTFDEEEAQYRNSKVSTEKNRKLNFYLRSRPAEILIANGYGNKHIGIDIGCGGGQNENFEHIYTKVTSKLVGVDVAIGALSSFRKNFPNASCIFGDAWKLPFEDSSCDFVTASGLIHHFIGQKKALSSLFNEIYRVLKGNGIFIFNEPNLLYPVSLIMHIPNRILQKIIPGARGRVPYERPIEFLEVRNVLRKARFANIGCEASSYAHHYMPERFINILMRKETILKKSSPIKYFGAWITMYGYKGKG